MDFGTFMAVAMIIVVFSETLRNILKSMLMYRHNKENQKEIDELKRLKNRQWRLVNVILKPVKMLFLIFI